MIFVEFLASVFIMFFCILFFGILFILINDSEETDSLAKTLKEFYEQFRDKQ